MATEQAIYCRGVVLSCTLCGGCALTGPYNHGVVFKHIKNRSGVYVPSSGRKMIGCCVQSFGSIAIGELPSFVAAPFAVCI